MSGWVVICLYFNMLQKLIFLGKSLDKANVVFNNPRKESFIPDLCWSAHSGLNCSSAPGEFPQACSYSGVSGSLRTSRWLGNSGGLWSQTELGVNSGSITFLTCSFINFILRQTWLSIYSQQVLYSMLGIAILGCRYFSIPILEMRKLEKQQGSDRVEV